jgi:hypothetical protein
MRGINTVIAGVTGRKIRVLSYNLTATAAGTVTFQDTAGSPVIAAVFSVPANGPLKYPGGINAPAFETAVGTGFVISNSAGVDTTGHLTYQLVR